MPLESTLLSLLIDPAGGGPLQLVEDGRRLHAPESGLYYPLLEGSIPVLLADEAQNADGSPAADLARDLQSKRIR